MKKTVFLVLTLVTALACAVSAFAWNVPEISYETIAEGTMLNASDVGSDTLAFRNDWTPGRNASNDCTSANPDDTWNSDSVAELDEDEDMVVAKWVAPQYLVSQYDSHFGSGTALLFGLKKGDTAGFNGFVFNYGTNDILPVETAMTQLSDYFYTEFPAKSSDDKAAYNMATGYGFTFLKDDNQKVRVFARCIKDGELDVIFYDVDTGVDLTKAYYVMGFFYKDGKATFEFEDKVGATITFADPASVSEAGLSGKYCRTVKIFDYAGTEVASTDAGLVYSGNENDLCLSLSGEGTTMYMCTMTVDEEADVATAPLDPNAPKATEAPKPTEAPATEAPKATEAPQATEAPKATEAPADKKGCGGMVSCGAALVLAAAALVLKKKEN